MENSKGAEKSESAGAWQPRSPVERRRLEDKRSGDSREYFEKGGVERRRKTERRKSGERRDKWLRVDKWRSVSVFDED